MYRLVITCCLVLPTLSDTGTLDSVERFSINEAKFVGTPGYPAKENEGLRAINGTWNLLNLNKCWTLRDQGEPQNKGELFSDIFGQVEFDKVNFRDLYTSNSTYWESAALFEQECLCKRRLSYLKPALSFRNLNRTVTYTRQRKRQTLFIWPWADNAREVFYLNYGNIFTTAMTAYKAIIILALKEFSEVRAKCEIRIIQATSSNRFQHWINWIYRQMVALLPKPLSPLKSIVVECNFTVEEPLFEPLNLHFWIQEEDELHEESGELLSTLWHEKRYAFSRDIRLAPSVNIWPESVPYPDELFGNNIIWIRSTGVGAKADRREGKPVRNPGPMTYYQTFPSMNLKSRRCKRRIRNAEGCMAPVGGLAVKLAFWDEIIYDPAQNRAVFPKEPVKMIDGIQAVTNFTQRYKRLALRTGAMFANSGTEGGPLGVWRGLKREILSYGNEIQKEILRRQLVNEKRLKRIADGLRALENNGTEESIQTIKNMWENAKHQGSEFVLSNWRRPPLKTSEAPIIISNLGDSLRELSDSQLVVDELIVNQIGNLSTLPRFEVSTRYHVQIARGRLRYKAYAIQESTHPLGEERGSIEKTGYLDRITTEPNTLVRRQTRGSQEKTQNSVTTKDTSGTQAVLEKKGGEKNLSVQNKKDTSLRKGEECVIHSANETQEKGGEATRLEWWSMLTALLVFLWLCAMFWLYTNWKTKRRMRRINRASKTHGLKVTMQRAQISSCVLAGIIVTSFPSRGVETTPSLINSTTTPFISALSTPAQVSAGLAALHEASFMEIQPGQLPQNWTLSEEATWSSVSLKDCWSAEKHANLRSPGLFYSRSFGWVKANKQTLAEYKYPQGRYWEKPTTLERECLCKRRIAKIVPGLSYASLRKEVTYIRPTGHGNRYEWDWIEKDEFENYANELTYVMTIYKTLTLIKLQDFASVTASCVSIKTTSLEKRTEPELHRVDWENGTLYAELPYKYCGNYYHNGEYVAPYYMGGVITIRCSFRGSHPAFEPILLDLMVQERDVFVNRYEEFDKIDSTEWDEEKHHEVGKIPYLNRIRLPPSINIWPKDVVWPKTHFKNSTRWIRTAAKEFWDGPPIKMAGPMSYYSSHPSLTREDEACRIRVSKNKNCASPVGGIETKLAFWDNVNFDPAKNKPVFPGSPMVLMGHGNAPRTMEQAQGTRRKKRQIFALATMLFTGVSMFMEWTQVHNLRQEMKDQISHLTNAINARFSQDETHLKAIADRLNAQAVTNFVRTQNIEKIVTEMLGRDRLQEQEIQQLSDEITRAERISLAELDTLLHVVQTTQTLSLAEIAVDKLVMTELQNKTGVSLFNKTTMYLARMERGALYYKEYAKQLLNEESHLRQGVQQFQANSSAWEETNKRNAASLEEYMKQVSKNLTKPVWLNDTGYVLKNITLLPWRNLTNETFLSDFVHALHSVGKEITGLVKEGESDLTQIIGTGLGGIGSIFGKGLAGFMKPLLKILIPIAVVVVAMILLCCLVQYHPRCSHRKAALPKIFQMRSATGAVGMVERAKHHNLKNLVKGGMETAAEVAL